MNNDIIGLTETQISLSDSTCSMYLRVAFDSFAVRSTFIFSEGLFACLQDVFTF